MKPLKEIPLYDKLLTKKYIEDVDTNTEYETLDINYIEQLRAVLNYCPVPDELPKINIPKKPDIEFTEPKKIKKPPIPPEFIQPIYNPPPYRPPVIDIHTFTYNRDGIPITVFKYSLLKRLP